MDTEIGGDALMGRHKQTCLSDHHRQIIALTVQGFYQKEIAARVGTTHKKVRDDMQHLFEFYDIEPPRKKIKVVLAAIARGDIEL